MPRAEFHPAAYLVATVFSALAVAVAVFVHESIPPHGALIAFSILMAIIGSVPAMVLMWPATMAAIYLANRFGWHRQRHYFLLGMAATVLTMTGLIVTMAIKVRIAGDNTLSGPVGRPIAIPDLRSIAVGVVGLALLGGCAGLVYRWVAKTDGSDPRGPVL